MATSYWAYFLNHFTHWQIAIPLTFVVHEVLYFAHYLPFFIGEKLPFLDKYKLQKVRPQALNRSFAYVARLFSALLLLILVARFGSRSSATAAISNNSSILNDFRVGFLGFFRPEELRISVARNPASFGRPFRRSQILRNLLFRLILFVIA